MGRLWRREAMGHSLISPFLFSTLFISLLQTSCYAAQKSYIVYMGEHSYAPKPTALDIEESTNRHYDILSSCLKSKQKAQAQMIYSYTRCINGFSAVLDDAQVAELKEHPDVVSIFLNSERKLHTTHSWSFLGLESNGVIPADGLWKKARFGRDIIIGNLDTGVWPEAPSFNDTGFGPVPSRWKGRCEPNSGVTCNRKLIGAAYFNRGYLKIFPSNETTYNTARDNDGHGSHTLSTAGGSFFRGASVFGIGNGTAKGGSPEARVAAYKVCWPTPDGSSCFDSDILAAFDAAIADGVDVLSVSLGGPSRDYINDATALGAFHAMTKGITVIASAGNDGPVLGTVTNVAPWFITVGASTMDRELSNEVTIGNNKSFKGASLSEQTLPSGKLYSLISAAHAKVSNATAGDALLCKNGTLDHKKVQGKILVCLRGEIGRVEKGGIAQLAGAIGMILANDEANGDDIIADAHVLPVSHITFVDGEAVFSYINSTKDPVGTISPVQTKLGVKPAPVTAAFSSRGPSTFEPAILKPDIIAPGVSVIAAYTGATSPSEIESDKRRVSFNSMSGTSMSCPHISGVVGLLKSLHGDWSPAAIRSAIMTTAKTRANNRKPILDATGLSAKPLAYGAGHVNPNHAADPGLVYDLTLFDYIDYLCHLGYNQTVIDKGFLNKSNETYKNYSCPKNFRMADFNYPSITLPSVNGPVTVSRKVKNVGSASTYTVRVKTPAGFSVEVEPTTLTFQKLGEEQTFKVTFKPLVAGAPKDYTFGRLIWSDGKHYVRSPLVVKHA